ncbi:MAG: hypothetical protein K2H70_02160 [Bacteroidales bacterium]|nr:hypothetical protein [Bacteroidales bacterium]
MKTNGQERIDNPRQIIDADSMAAVLGQCSDVLTASMDYLYSSNLPPVCQVAFSCVSMVRDALDGLKQDLILGNDIK